MQQKLYGQPSAESGRRQRAGMWRVVCRVVLQRYVRPQDTVLDLGAGSCEIINAIQCGRKIAVDANPRLRELTASGIVPVIGEIPGVLEQMVDACAQVVFCSNFLQRLRDKESVLRVLHNVHRLLAPEGRVIIIQPNIRYAYKKYWDVFDHRVPLSHSSLSEALQMSGFDIEVLRPRFLPGTSGKSSALRAAWLMRLYLALPPVRWLLGKQMLVVAKKPKQSRVAG